MLDVVKLGEQALFFWSAKILELFEGLTPQVAAVDKKEHSPSTAVFDEPVDEVAGREGLSTA